MESQNDSIIRYLLAGGTLTALQAKDLFGCMRLAARIDNLLNKGYAIAKQTIRVRGPKHVTRYSIMEV